MPELFICLFVITHTFPFCNSSKIFGAHVIYSSRPWSVFLGVCFIASFPLCALLGLMPLWFASGQSGTAWLMALTEHSHRQRICHISGLVFISQRLVRLLLQSTYVTWWCFWIPVHIFVSCINWCYVGMNTLKCGVRTERTPNEFIIH